MLIGRFLMIIPMMAIAGNLATKKIVPPSAGTFPVHTPLFVVLLIGVILIQAVISWVNPYAPLAPLFNALTGPFLRPFRRLVPLIGNVDLSPLLALVAAQLLLIPLEYLSRSVAALL